MKRGAAIILFLFLITGVLFSQEEQKGVSVGLGVELGGGVFLIIPETSGYISVPINFNSTFTLTPKVGFSYLFNIAEETHTNYFIPIGVDFLLNTYHFGFSLKYFLSVQNISGEHWLVAALTGYVPFIRKGNINFFMQLEFGPAFLIRPGNNLLVYTHIHPALCFQYFF